MDINFEHLSLRELRDLQSKVNKAIDTYEIRMKKQALEELEERARSFGFTLAELVESQTAKRARKRSEAAAKYANPADHTQTWTGRGRKPGWFIQALEEGRSPEYLLV
jgi:DNA-binding protein H-NS